MLIHILKTSIPISPMSTSYAGNNDGRMRHNPRSRTSTDTGRSSIAQSADWSLRNCCSCCLSVRSTNSDSRRPGGPSVQSQVRPPADDLQPTADEVRLWGESFDNVMNSGSGRKCFRDFLKCEYSEENILFWQACEDLKKETNPETVEEKARIIYEDYISILSPKEVSLDSRVREIINRNMVEPSRSTFDEAQLQIFTLMHRDSYPRFVNSPQYRALLEKFGLKPAPKQNNSGASSESAPRTSSSNIRTSIS